MSAGLQLFSTVGSNNTLTLSLSQVDVGAPGADEIVVEIEAAPLNPSDMATLFAAADVTTARSEKSGDQQVTVADIPPAFLSRFSTRLDKAHPVGNEAAGKVVQAGESEQAQALLGQTVSFATGGNYGQFRRINCHQCMPMGSVSARDAASAFVNPMTALGFFETMRMEGHKALINTAAASNLGQMINRIGQADGVEVVNVVRKADQKKLLTDMGAKYVVDSSEDGFLDNLTDAISDTGATLAFDAIGGGKMADTLLTAMERSAAKDMEFYDHYGSRVHKQLYVYGALDRINATPLSRMYGFAWSMGGWLLTNFLGKVEMETLGKMQKRIASEITTTFKTHYSHEISLQQALDPEIIAGYAVQATGEKYLICPNK